MFVQVLVILKLDRYEAVSPSLAKNALLLPEVANFGLSGALTGYPDERVG